MWTKIITVKQKQHRECDKDETRPFRQEVTIYNALPNTPIYSPCIKITHKFKETCYNELKKKKTAKKVKKVLNNNKTWEKKISKINRQQIKEDETGTNGTKHMAKNVEEMKLIN